jgi:YbbR domain-containing protein
MVNKRFRAIFSSKTFYIIFSLLASVALWLYVEYIENPDTTNLISGIAVEFLNRDLVTDKRLVVTEVEVETLSLRLSGKRGVVWSLDKSNIHVTVDLAQITGSGQNKLDYRITYPDTVSARDITVVSRSEDYITVNVENIFDKSVQIFGEYTEGNIAMEGYQAETMTFAPDTITVYGPESLVLPIARAQVYIQRSNLIKTTVEDLPYTLLDANGDELSTDGLTFDRETVTVTIPIKMVKDVPLRVKLIDGAGATEENTIVTVTPEKLTLSGEAADMNLNYILLATVDLSKFESSYTSSFTVVLPNGINNLTGTTEAVVTISIAGLDTIHLSATNIQTVNVTEGYVASLITQSLDVVIRGKADDIAGLTAENIRVVADLTDLGDTTGTYSVYAKVMADGASADVGAVGDYKVTVTLARE